MDACEAGECRVVAPEVMEDLIRALVGRGYRVVGPMVRDGAIILDELHDAADLPQGWSDEQEAGRYRLIRHDEGRLFAYAVGPGSPRRWFTPPRRRLWSATSSDGRLEVDEERAPSAPVAFVGIRPCDLAAIAVQDRVLGQGAYAEPLFTATRDGAFVVVVNCAHPASTCFCSSMGTGPFAGGGFDLAVTELVDGGSHRLLVEVGTAAGADVLAGLAARPAEPADMDAARRQAVEAAEAVRRRVDPDVARRALARNLEHPQWDDVARRCLSCGNCTMVCPTCFCSAVEDVASLDGGRAERMQRWDSCFARDHSYLHGAGPVRTDIRTRYRQWLTHKFSTWWDQFGECGCVGCGRCITWCPVAIDLTEELAAIAAANGEGEGEP